MINNRFKELRLALGLTQTELGIQLGKALRTIQDYESGKSGITVKNATRLKELYGVNINWLINGIGEMFIDSAFEIPLAEISNSDNTDILTIPHYTNVSAAAGSGSLVYDETSVKQVRISSSIINTQHSNNICIINATGQSMQPMINDGDLLIVDLNHKEYLDEGIYVVRLDNSLLVKHLQKIPNGMCLISENPKFQPITLTADNFNENEASVIGKVLSVIKNLTSDMM